MNGIQKEYDNNHIIIDGMTADYNKFLSLAKTDKDANRLNCIDPPIKVISENSLASGLATIENRFLIAGHYKYTFNNGHLARADLKAAATRFLNASEKRRYWV